MNLPNAITLGRIFLVPLLVVVLMTNPKELPLFGVSKEILGALIFAVASLTDWLDGYLARRRKQITGLGQWMDPLADKVLVTAALVSLVQMDVPEIHTGNTRAKDQSRQPSLRPMKNGPSRSR